MAEEPSKSGFNLPWANIVALLVAGGGLLTLIPSLRTSRPPDPGGESMPVFGDQTVASRLWQDPFEEVMKDSTNGNEKREEHTSQELEKAIHWNQNWSANNFKPQAEVKVMIVMMMSGQHAEPRERRLRTRTAVVEGLSASRYTPSDSEHLGYVRVPWPRRSYMLFDAQVDKAQVDNYQVIPFEWFERRRDPEPHRVQGSDHFLVLYLAEDACHGRPFTRLAYLSNLLGLGSKTGDRFVPTIVLGPVTSTVLERMVNELNEFDKTDESNRTALKETHELVRQQLRGMEIFCPTATASFPADGSEQPNGKKIKDWATEWIQQTFAAENLIFQRTIPTDGDIIWEMINELKRRGINPTNWLDDPKNPKAKVAIISELDSYYGRALPKTFQQLCGQTAEESAPWIHDFCYLRGLDGRLPGDEKDKKSGDTSNKEEQKRAPGARPDGHDQTDSLLRLAELIASKDRALRNQGGPGFRAIGVLGSDLYDKLLILRALRPRFPDVVFFTNNLDAQLSQPEEWEAAHNLVVVSAFGLRLHDRWQRNIPPFRDGYQTATFLGTLVATGEVEHDPVPMVQNKLLPPLALSKIMDVPRVFEIGRNGALDLSVNYLGGVKTNEDGTWAFKNAQVAEYDEKNRPIIRIHPPRTDLKQWWSRAVKHHTLLGEISVPVSSVLGIVCLGAFAVIFYRAAAYIPLPLPAGNAAPEKSRLLLWVERNYPIGRIGAQHVHRVSRTLVRACENLSTIIVSILAAAFAVVIVSFFYGLQWVEGEPFAWFDGLSIWPGVAIRIFAIILAIHFVVKSYVSLLNNDVEIFKRFSLRGDNHKFSIAHALWPWTNPLSHDKRLANLDCALPFRDESFDALELWRQYIWRGWWWHRLVRVVTLTLLFLLGSWFAFVAFDGGFGSSTARSGIARWCDRGSTGLLFIAATFVTLFVVDALCLNASFVRLCDSGFACWPENVLKRSGLVGPWKKGEITEEQERVTEKLNIQLAATRTATVGEFVLYPFVIIALLVVSRAPYFDDWGWTVGLIIVLAALLGLATLAAVNLRRAAEKARKGALGRLQATRDGAATQDGMEKRVRILDILIKRIADLDEGAFAPFSQQPIIRALLFPAGGIGMWEMARQLLGKL